MKYVSLLSSYSTVIITHNERLQAHFKYNFIFFFFTKTCIRKSLKSVSPLKWTHERQKKLISKTAFNILHICIYIYIFFQLYPSIRHGPQKCHPHVVPTTAILMWSPQLPSHVVPRNAILMWSPQLPSHVFLRNAILMWSPQLPSHMTKFVSEPRIFPTQG